MKCPKCGYLGFEHLDRCRNCGYDFSLNAPAVVPDLSLRSDSAPLGPPADLSLTRGAASAPDLPLFGSPVAPVPDDEPLITRPSPPRQPLAVRRSTPDLPRLRSEQPRLQSLDLSLDEPPPQQSIDRATAMLRAHVLRVSDAEQSERADASIAARVIAVILDVLILAAIDLVVIYFTLKICGITVEDLGILPKGPLIAFLLVQNGGYLVAFTAGGQTLGKMIAGIRVVSAEHDAPPDLGRAFLRELMWVVLAVPAGVGLLSALLSRDHRGFHDRFAGTRVVR